MNRSPFRIKYGLYAILLLVICIAVASSVLPGIGKHLDNPNLIPYFNVDEGYLMDLMWYYYSGEIRDSFQMTLDYGLEMVYVVKFCRIFLSEKMVFTPGTFVMIFRYIHLISWIAAIICLWGLVGRHFRKGAEQVVVAGLLAVSPSFGYFMNSLKPDPLLLLIMVLGMDYTLRMIDKPRTAYFIAVIFLSAMGFVVKFSGIFMLLPLIASLYISRQMLNNENSWIARFNIRGVWCIPLVASAVMIALPIAAIFIYVRKTSGMTYFQEYGFWQAFIRYKIATVFGAAGLSLAAFSIALYKMSRSRKDYVREIWKKLEIFGSYSVFAAGAFIIALLIVGFGWLLMPAHFFETYFLNGMDFTGGEILKQVKTIPQLTAVYSSAIAERLGSLDIVMLALFAVYALVEYNYRTTLAREDEARRRKRLLISVYLIPFFMMMFTLGRFTNHHALIFTVFVSLLAVEGIYIIMTRPNMNMLVKSVIGTGAAVYFLIDLTLGGYAMAKERMYELRKDEDVCFEVEKWIRNNLPQDARILTDYHTRAYVPPYLNNPITLKHGGKDRLTQITELINDARPRYIYLNEGTGDENLPPIEKIVTGGKTRLLAYFESKGRQYQRRRGDKYVIYEIFYESK